MAVLVFVLFWVAVAIGLVVIGIRSGRRDKPTDVNVARRGRAHWYVGFAIVVLAFGVGLPIASGLGRQNDAKQNASSGITDLTAEEEHGRELFATYCNQCHTLSASAGVAQVGPNLDVLRPTEGLVRDAVQKGRARGNGAMAANLVTGSDLDAVAKFVAKAVGQDEPQ